MKFYFESQSKNFEQRFIYCYVSLVIDICNNHIFEKKQTICPPNLKIILNIKNISLLILNNKIIMIVYHFGNILKIITTNIFFLTNF